jgi:hypothetical protein
MLKITMIKEKTCSASFVPYTQYLVYVGVRDGDLRELVVYNYRTNTVAAKMAVNFIIERVIATHRSILMTSLDHLYTVHFPSLKAIYEGFAGNGISVVCDISREGNPEMT